MKISFLSDKALQVVYRTGIVMLLLGILDPLEGSVVIVVGSSLVAIAAWNLHKPYRYWLLVAWLMVVSGVAYLFFISSLGGFLGNTGRSWVWGLPILPYPLGWLLSVVVLILQFLKSKRSKTVQLSK